MPDEQAARIRVLNYNILYDKSAGESELRAADKHPWLGRRDSLLERIRGLDCDLLGLQECRHEQYCWLRQQLGGEYGTFGEQSTKITQIADHKSEYCPVWWKLRRFELEDQGSRWLNARNERGRAVAPLCNPRLCTWVRLRDKLTGRSLHFGSTHFDNVLLKPLAGIVNGYHELCIEWLDAHFKALAAAAGGDPALILVGDFNLAPDKRAYGKLASHWQDCYAAPADSAADERRATCHSFKERGGTHIDYVWINARLARRQFSINPGGGPAASQPSDHYPLVAELDWA